MDKVYDFYFSEKFYRSLGWIDSSYNIVNIRGKKVVYTEMITSGNVPLSKWDDLQYVGSAKSSDIEWVCV